MPQFRLAAKVIVSAYTTVEAETEVDARRIAQSRPVASAGGPEQRREFWLVYDCDGSPQEIHLDDD